MAGRIFVIAAIVDAIAAFALAWTFRAKLAQAPTHHQATPAEVVKAMTPAQRQAYREGIALCDRRITRYFQPRSEAEGSAAASRFETCAASLGVMLHTTWEPRKKRWRIEYLAPPQGLR